MLKKLLSVIGIILVLIAWTVGGQFGREVGKAAFKPPLEAMLAEVVEAAAARQINVTTPIMIDEETRLDKATVGPGAQLTYHYTLLNYTASQLDPAQIQTDLRSSVKA